MTDKLNPVFTGLHGSQQEEAREKREIADALNNLADAINALVREVRAERKGYVED